MVAAAKEVTPDIRVLARMLWTDQPHAITLADNVDPAVFPTKASRKLFCILAREAPNGFSSVTVRELVKSEASECLPLFDDLIGSLGTAALDNDDSSPESLAEAAAAWSQRTKLGKALSYASEALEVGSPYSDVRQVLERHLTAIDLSALAAKSYDDKQDMARRVRDYLDSERGKGLPFGFAKLDSRVTPTLIGNLVIVAGRPGTGKSTQLRNWSRNWVRGGENVAYFSFEMTGEEKLPLFACMDAGIDYRHYVRQELSPTMRERFDNALHWWVEARNFWLNERSDVTPEWVIRMMRRYRAEGVTTFVIDHLHRVRYTSNAKGDIRLAIGDFTKSLKSFAVESGCRVIAGAQFTKGDKHEEPGDEMIRETGNILEEADKIFLTWLPLVEGEKTIHGDFMPVVKEGGRRVLASEAGRDATLGMDSTRAYLKIGKQRIRQADGYVALPFNAATGLIADLSDGVA